MARRLLLRCRQPYGPPPPLRGRTPHFSSRQNTGRVPFRTNVFAVTFARCVRTHDGEGVIQRSPVNVLASRASLSLWLSEIRGPHGETMPRVASSPAVGDL
jgi:hypothetical protein